MTTLLAVDDSKTMRRVIEITFAGEQHRLVLAETADDALAKLRSEQPAVVLIDANLGGSGGGYGLCQTVKREAPQARVLLLSSKQQPYDRPRGGSSGADDFIDKPFDTQQLIDKVNNLVRAAAAAPVPVMTTQPTVQGMPAQGERQRAPTLAYGSPGATAPAPRVSTQVGPAGAQPGFGSHPQTVPSGPPVAAPPPVAIPVHPAPAAPEPVAAPVPAVAAAPAATAVGAALAENGQLAGKLGGLGLNPDQISAVLALSREVVERVVWEVVPVLAETLIKEEIRRLTAE